MFRRRHEHADEWDEFRDMSLYSNRKAEEVKDHYLVFDKLRNPKSEDALHLSKEHRYD